MTVAVVDLGRTAFNVDATHLYVERSSGTVDEILTVLTTVYNPEISGCVSAIFSISTRPGLDTSELPFDQVIIGGGLPIAVHWKITGEVSFTVRVAGPVTWMVGTAAQNEKGRNEFEEQLITHRKSVIAGADGNMSSSSVRISRYNTSTECTGFSTKFTGLQFLWPLMAQKGQRESVYSWGMG